MLVPAILYKDELEKRFAEKLYTEDAFYYNGYAYGNTVPTISVEDNRFQFAILDKDKVVGWLAYSIIPESDTICNFGLMGFDNNITVAKDLKNKLEELVKNHRRLEWRMIGGNKVEKHYDKFCFSHGGNKVVLHDVTKDELGYYHDECIYEIVNGEVTEWY